MEAQREQTVVQRPRGDTVAACRGVGRFDSGSRQATSATSAASAASRFRVGEPAKVGQSGSLLGWGQAALSASIVRSASA